MGQTQAGRRRDPEATRAALIDAAAAVFAERGFQAASLEEIVTLAGYTRGAYYWNFSSKEELFLAVIEERQRSRITATDAVIDASTSPEEFNTAQRARAAELPSPERRQWVLLMMEFWLHAARSPDLHKQAADLKDQQRRSTARQLEQLTEAASLDLPAPPALIAAALVALEDGFALQEALDAETITQDTLWDAVDLLTRAVTHLAATSSPPEPCR